LDKSLLILLIFLKNQIFCFIDSLYSFFGLHFIDLDPDLYYFSPSAGLEVGLFLFF
jgi:hypothetical protein